MPDPTAVDPVTRSPGRVGDHLNPASPSACPAAAIARCCFTSGACGVSTSWATSTC